MVMCLDLLIQTLELKGQEGTRENIHSIPGEVRVGKSRLVKSAQDGDGSHLQERFPEASRGGGDHSGSLDRTGLFSTSQWKARGVFLEQRCISILNLA